MIEPHMNEANNSISNKLNPNLNSQLFIPDICQANALLILLILTQLLALVVTLIQSQNALINWESLGLTSMFCHTEVLSSAAMICGLRQRFSRLSPTQITWACMTIILGTTAILSMASLQLSSPAEPLTPVQLILKNLMISAIIGGLLLRYFYLQHQWRQQKQAELHARLEALQARIRPHFLFNSMNSIASLVAIDPQKAEDAILDLSTLFRATLQNQSMLIALEDELDLSRRYLNIEALRLGERLKIDWHVDSQINKSMIPPLTLQPLFENAIYHGIQPLTEGGTIKLEGYLKDNNVTLLLSNPYKSQSTKHQGNQIALENIRNRLEGIFQSKAILKTSQLNDVFTVTLRFPFNKDRIAGKG